ncbi:MAG: class I SAM-dependent methyltransferase [Kofleriaceae bacterium]
MLTKVLARQLLRPAGLLGRMVSQVMEATNKEAYREALGAVELSAATHLLEIGYGPGDGLAMVRRRAPACRLSGVDFSPLMHARARARLRAAGGEVELLCGDFLDAPLPRGAYSHVLCVNVVYFWPQLAPPLGKIAELLAPGGALVLFTRHEAYLEKKQLLSSGVFHRHGTAAIEAALREAGLSTTQLVSDAGVVFRADKPAATQR